MKNGLTETTLPQAGSNPDEQIGFAFLDYSTPPLPPSWLTAEFLYLLIRSELRRRHVDYSKPGRMSRPGVCVCTFMVKDWRPAVRALFDVARENRLLLFCEIAYFDHREGLWRTLHPVTGASLCFDRFLRDEDIEAARQEIRESIERSKAT